MTNFVFISKSVRFFTNLHLARTIKNLQYTYRKDAIIYAFMCNVTRMVYVGSTLTPGRRFHNHLVTGNYSNIPLQEAIAEHGIQNFVAYVLEIVILPKGLDLEGKKAYLKGVEQTYIDKFPEEQLYNEINAKSK